MKHFLKQLKSALASRLKLPFLHAKYYYSQEGEDIILEKIFINTSKGFYVDIGAHHPYRYSNTYKLYNKGWRGLNVDPNTKSIIHFNLVRKKDINIKAAVTNKNGESKYYIFEEEALNTLDQKIGGAVIKSKQSKLMATETVRTIKLSNLFERYLPQGQNIDLLNVDVEGMELAVLDSITLKKYKPQVIAVESLRDDKIIFALMKINGYKLIAKTINTSIFYSVKPSSNKS